MPSILKYLFFLLWLEADFSLQGLLITEVCPSFNTGFHKLKLLAQVQDWMYFMFGVVLQKALREARITANPNCPSRGSLAFWCQSTLSKLTLFTNKKNCMKIYN